LKNDQFNQYQADRCIASEIRKIRSAFLTVGYSVSWFFIMWV